MVCLSLFSRRDWSPERGSSVWRVCATVPETEETERSGIWKLKLWRNKVAMGGSNRSFFWGSSLKQALTEDKIIPESASGVNRCPWAAPAQIQPCYKSNSVLFYHGKRWMALMLWVRFSPLLFKQLPPAWWLRTSGTFSCALQQEVIPGSLPGREQRCAGLLISYSRLKVFSSIPPRWHSSSIQGDPLHSFLL